MRSIPLLSNALSAAAMIFLIASPADAKVVATVGSEGAGCQFQDLQAAIDFVSASADPDREVRVTNERLVDGVALEIDTSLTLAGGFGDCGATTPPSGRRTLLQGAVLGTGAPAVDSVVRIVSPGSEPITVTLRNLGLERGQAIDGGGLHVSGDVDLRLESCLLLNNTANRGGGIFASSGAQVTLLATGVNGNRTQVGPSVPSGGGIFCRDAVLTARNGSSALGNEAVAGGGGIAAANCDVELVGPFDLSNNRARFGGGLSANGSNLLLRPGASGLVAVERNRAVRTGAGFPSGAGFSIGSSNLLAQDARVRENRTDSLDSAHLRTGGAMSLFLGARATFERTLGADCPDRVCSDISFNEAGDGGVAKLSTDASLTLINTTVDSNRADLDLFAMVDGSDDPATELTLDGVTVVRNVAERLFRLEGNSSLDLLHTTVAFNEVSIAAFEARAATSPTPPSIALRSSILHQPFLPVALLDLGAQTLSADCLVVHDDLPFGGQSRVIEADPELVIDGRGNDRLGSTSPAIDLCGPAAGDDRDIDLDARGLDDPLVVDQAPGSFFDAGADERVRPASEMPAFADSFEDGDLSAWSAAQG